MIFQLGNIFWATENPVPLSAPYQPKLGYLKGRLVAEQSMHTISEFKAIATDATLYAFLRKYGFIEDTNPTPSNILGVHNGVLEGSAAKITHRWYDPSGPFQNEPDIHKALLEVAGHGRHEITYEG